LPPFTCKGIGNDETLAQKTPHANRFIAEISEGI
jgi:hypothetical protein